MYAVSCTAALRLTCFAPKNIPYNTLLATIRGYMSPGAPVGYTALVELRSIAVSLAPFEGQKITFSLCTSRNHGL